MIKCISFDLQGTITKADFCDSFWLIVLPKIYSEKNNISLEEAKKEIKNQLKKKEYDLKYYDDSYWTKLLNFDAKQELYKINKKPEIDMQFINFIKTIKLKKIIVSTTTNLFINLELREYIKVFDKIYSCVDYFNIGGKRPEIFAKVAEELKIDTKEILHIGDNYVMDIENARKAGVKTIYYTGNTEETIHEIKKYMEI